MPLWIWMMLRIRTQNLTVINMDLLYKHILGVPQNEKLVAVYVVDDVTLYASTYVSDTQYNLYSVSNHNIVDFLTSVDMLSKLDTIVGQRHYHVVEQRAHKENDMRIVTYKTDKFREQHLKKPSSERTEITRFTPTRRHKLF